MRARKNTTPSVDFPASLSPTKSNSVPLRMSEVYICQRGNGEQVF